MQLKNSIFRSRFTSSFRFAYTWLLPLVIAILILIVSSKEQRSPFLGSWSLDFFARLYITVFLSAGLIILPRPEKLRRWFYGKELNTPATDTDIAVNLFIVFCGLVYGIFAALIWSWVMRVFLPSLASVNMIITVLSGFVYAIPIIIRGKDFVL